MIVYCVIGNVKHYTREKHTEWCYSKPEVDAVRARLESQGCQCIYDKSQGDRRYEFEFDKPKMERGIVSVCLTAEKANEVVRSGEGREIVIKNLDEIIPEALPRS